jgi:sulfhydrogenase subunit beta (sulfur reductase)
MARGAIKKNDLGKLIAAVRKGAKFFGPVDTGDGVRLSDVSNSDSLSLDYGNFTLPPKLVFFPRSEVVANHQAGRMVPPPLPNGKVVLFGLRPCDAMSLAYLDKVFVDEKFTDPYYAARRSRTLVISLACREPAATCFCSSVKGSPHGQAGADILAVDLGDSLVLDSITPAGEGLMAEHAKLLAKPTAGQLKAVAAQAAHAANKVPRLDLDAVAARLKASSNPQAWDRLAERCLGCGACTFLCPTCHCFALYDEQVAGQTRRVRTHDACALAAFALEASGHNPRTTQGTRMHHRVMHKFCHAIEMCGDFLCVGCGRCVSRCPTNLDIRQILAEVP